MGASIYRQCECLAPPPNGNTAPLGKKDAAMTKELLLSRSARPTLIGLVAGTLAVVGSLFVGGAWSASADGGTTGTTGATTPTPAAIVAPGAPLNVTAIGGGEQATVKWDAPASDGGAMIFAYIVIGDPAGVAIVGGGAREATVKHLTNGQAYTFKVAAVNRAALGPYSASSASVTPAPVALTAPHAPMNVTAKPGNKNVVVKWDAPASDSGAKIFAYIVLGDPSGAKIVGGGDHTAVVTGLTNGRAYTFKVAAMNKVGMGPFSAPSATVTPVASANEKEGKGDKGKGKGEDHGKGDEHGKSEQHRQDALERALRNANALLTLREAQINAHAEVATAWAEAHHDAAEARIDAHLDAAKARGEAR